MLKNHRIIFTVCATAIFATVGLIAYADSTPIIINNNTNSPPANNQPAPNTSGCTGQTSVDPNAQRPGTYYQSNPNGGTDTVYTTGDKTPYNADINCNNTPVQPYVYAPAPMPPGPTPIRH